MIHIRYAGRSLDMSENALDIRAGMSDAEIKARVARRLEVAPESLRDYVVDRSPSGNVIIRPEAVYG
jgi:predicted KAP-like P-loop ATPase